MSRTVAWVLLVESSENRVCCFREAEQRERTTWSRDIYSVVRLIWNRHSNDFVLRVTAVEADRSHKVVECKYARARAPRVVVVCVSSTVGLELLTVMISKCSSIIWLYLHASHTWRHRKSLEFLWLRGMWIVCYNIYIECPRILINIFSIIDSW